MGTRMMRLLAAMLGAARTWRCSDLVLAQAMRSGVGMGLGWLLRLTGSSGRLYCLLQWADGTPLLRTPW
jgi:hypothetical protein